MAKKNESVLGLPPVAQSQAFGSSRSVVSYGNLNASTPDERRIIAEYRKETMVIEGVKEKAIFALNQIAMIHQHGVTTFDDSAAFITDLKQIQRSKEHQAYTDEFCERSIQMHARHTFGVMEVAATNIGVEVHRSLYPVSEPPVPEKPKTLLQRLLG
ncbi:MAG: hypothetical protein H8D23_21285 [Candidatus Brocadiales bacterium]|nr:hypothetical protein [Candidatus Brocadiales bacterium]